MQRLAFPLLLIFVVMAAACGGGNDGGEIIIDTPDSAPVEESCNPVAQSGCLDGEKCTWVEVSENPALGRTQCMPDGTVTLGDPCLPAGLNEGDECRAGGHCIAGVCTPVCSRTPDSCGEGFLCNLFENLFDDLEGIGACRPLCDPVLQDCPEGEACYLAEWTGEGTCGVVFPDVTTKTQDETCFGPSPDTCYLNGCARGFDTFGVRWNGFDSGVCMQFCTPATTGLDPVNGDQLDYIRGNPNGVSCGDYDVSAGEIANTECRFFNALILDDGVDTPDALGVCISEATRTALGMGSCTTHVLDAEPTTENVDNGTYVLGCESIQDLLAPAASRPPGAKVKLNLPESVQRRQAEIREQILRIYGLE
jgi:hypothetical protein